MEWGREIPALLQVKEEFGITPKALANRPLPKRDCTKYREAFGVLSVSRYYGENGPQPISLSDILAFFVLSGIDDMDDREVYRNHIQSMDGVFLEHSSKKMKEEMDKQKK